MNGPRPLAPGVLIKTRTATLATAVTEVLAPAHLSIALGLTVAVHSTDDTIHGIGWGALAVVFTGLIPYAFVLLGVRRGKWATHHIPDRHQRPAALLFGLGSVLVGLAALVLLSAPGQLLALVVAQLVGLLVALTISLVWKISIHTAVAFGTVIILALVLGPWSTVALVLAVAVGWSRLELRAHTLAQVIGGAAVGTFVAGSVFTALTT
jgi:membrane-associated phospholipid phosphatase